MKNNWQSLKGIVALLLIICTLTTRAQNIPTPPPTEKQSTAIQFSGIVVTDDNGKMVPVPYANLFIPKRKTGATANYQGFFSIVVEHGETVNFTALGFRNRKFKVPDSLHEEHYSMVQIMSRDTILLDEAVIFPWPNRDHFKNEFLAMDVTNQLEKRAMENLAKETLDKVRELTPYDGRETGSIYLRQQAKNYYYYGGQTPPMNIFNPLAWQQFFKAWSNGDFKKKNATSDYTPPPPATKNSAFDPDNN